MGAKVLLLLLGYLTNITQSLNCHICGFSTFPPTQEGLHYLPDNFQASCKYQGYPDEKHMQACNDTENSCAGLYFVDKENNGFTIRTCIPLFLKRLQNACATFAGNNEKNISGQMLAKLFNVNMDQSISILYCSCNTDGCDPFRQYLKYENFKGNDYSRRTVIAIFDKSTFSKLKSLARHPETTKNATNSTNTATVLPNQSQNRTSTLLYQTLNLSTEPTKTFSVSTKPTQTSKITFLEEYNFTSSSSSLDSGIDNFTTNTSIAHDSFITPRWSDINVSTTPMITFKENNETKTILWVAPTTSTVLGVLVVVVLLYLWRLKHRQRAIPHTLAELSLNSHSPNNVLENEPFSSVQFNKDQAKNLNEIADGSFKIDETALLGSGTFGKVCRGTVCKHGINIDVAIKMTKAQSDESAIQGLLSEIKTLTYIGYHANIIQLIGFYKGNPNTGNVYVFLEFCSLGSLHTYLQSVEPQAGSTTLTDEMVKSLHLWALQISKGMDFIATKRLVHADLATRNVLLTANKIAKICDFGLSRRLYNYSTYAKQKQEPLPWRWMAPESLRKLIFNEKTDVWAFGVTLWELYTFADVPYPGFVWTNSFFNQLEEGFRLEKPKFSTESLYNQMLHCWDIDPRKRPTFSEIVINFTDLVKY